MMKENVIPLGKKKETLNKIREVQKSDELEVVANQTLSKKKLSINKKVNKTNRELKPLKVIVINDEIPDTSLKTPIAIPRTKLSTIKETEEKLIKSTNATARTKLMDGINTMTNSVPITNENKSDSKEKGSTKSVRILQEEINEDNFNNTVDEMTALLKSDPSVPEVVLSPYVCTTRGRKWKPSPSVPAKLSDLLGKYENDDNIADLYRKKLDGKTVELQNKVKYWTELSSEDDSNIPPSIKDEINVVCGQTVLLTTDKFMQMRSLIEEFDNKSGPMPITTSDLDGFWDMLLLQVEKLEGQFCQLTVLKENNWIPSQPIVKTIINNVPKVNKPKQPVVKSKITDFIKNRRLKAQKETSVSGNSSGNLNNSRFNEMKLSNNTCLISSTPSSLNTKNVSFTPVLLKTIELSYVARRSGMTPIVLGTPHNSPLKPALKNPNQEKGTKRKNIHFENSKKSSDPFVTPENSPNDVDDKKKSIKDRVVTPHALKVFKVDVTVKTQKVVANSANTDSIKSKKINVKRTIATAKNCSLSEKSADTQHNNDDSTIRRSSRLANKPMKNYKY